MSQLFMLDTNIVSYILRGKSAAARAKLAGLRSNQVASVSVITEAEIRYGVAKGGGKLREAVDAFFLRLRVLDWDRDAAAAYGELRARQEKKGKPLGNLDLLIAAHAIAAGAVLVTNDKAFHQVSVLRGIENWALDI